MINSKTTIAAIIEKIETIALNQYAGNVSDNIYSIYPSLSDVEKILFLKYAYKLNRAFLVVMDIADIHDDTIGQRSSRDVKINDTKEYRRELTAEEYDKRELINLKHKSVIYASQMLAIVLGIGLIVIILASFMNNNFSGLLEGVGDIAEMVLVG